VTPGGRKVFRKHILQSVMAEFCASRIGEDGIVGGAVTFF